VFIAAPFCDTQDEAVARARFADLYALDPVPDNTGVHSFAEIQQKVFDSIAMHGDRKYLKGISYQYFSVPFLTYVHAQMTAFIQYLGPEAAKSAIILKIYPHNKIRTVPDDGTAFANRRNSLNCVIAMRWTSPEHDNFARQWIGEFVEGVRTLDAQMAKERAETVVVKGGYTNFEMQGDIDKAADGFRENLPRLKEIKKKWDPHGRFNKWFPIPVA
jgi:hypothetical protein